MTMSQSPSQFDRLAELRRERAETGRLYHEFLRRPSMSAGLYELPAGSTDPQQPHDEDELYYVIDGTASFECDGVIRPAAAGDTIFVAAHAPHRFLEITKDLSVLVVFAPAESA
jgi:mannose-6-phosphate isomerase-like protein (cupin superfamily)